MRRVAPNVPVREFIHELFFRVTLMIAGTHRNGDRHEGNPHDDDPADARATLRREVETAAKTLSSALKILDRYGHKDVAAAIRRTWGTRRCEAPSWSSARSSGKSSVINAIAGA